MENDIVDIRVNEFRCSLIWVSLLKTGGIFEKHSDYRREFENADSRHSEWSVPWTDKLCVFWEKYLEQDKLTIKDKSDRNTFISKKAAHCLVPLRVRNTGKIKLLTENQTIQKELTVWAEGFAYPHGIACIITLRWQAKEGIELYSMVDLLVKLRNGTYQWSKPATEPFCIKNDDSINHISQEISRYISEKTKGVLYDNPCDYPYTIATIVDAENVQLTGKPEEFGVIHRSLDSICTFNNRWRSANILRIKDASLKTKGWNKHDTLYARGRGRAVWLPEYFRQHHQYGECRSIRYIGCYHRNLTLATMQMAYLSSFLKNLYDKKIQQQISLTGVEQDLAREAAGAVARLYGGCKDSYKYSYMSSSLPKQIHPVEKEINAIRSLFIPTGKCLGECNEKNDNDLR